MTVHEQELLLDCAKYKTSISGWGSWMFTAASKLRSIGLMKRGPRGSYSINEQGRKVADEIWAELHT